jgi:patatin-like phospholipase/acyl hydrolase
MKFLVHNGGGLLGVLSEAIEKRLGILKADVYMGDSIGAIISAMRAIGKSPAAVLDLLVQHAPEIFEHSTLDAVEDMQGLCSAKYRSEPLHDVLVHQLGNITFGDLDCQCIMPSWSLTNDGPYWFHKGQDDSITLVDGCMASSACPILFSSYPIMAMRQNFGDGGWTCHAPADKVSFLFHPEDVEAVLAIGTGMMPECNGRMDPLDWGLLSWLQKDIMSAFARLREKESDQNCRMFFGDKYRLINPLCETIGIDDVSKISRMQDIGATADLGDVPAWLAARWSPSVPSVSSPLS